MADIICFDIGGTAVKYGVLSAAGAVLTKGSFPTQAEGGVELLLSRLTAQVQAMQQQYRLVGISVATAGIVDAAQGRIIYALPKIAGYTGTAVKQRLEASCGLRCEVENDVNCAGLAEQQYGSAQGSPLTVCVAVGSGIGGAVLVNGQIIGGAGGCAGEVGFLHMGGATLEEKAAVPALLKRTAELKGLTASSELDGRQVFAWAKAGDAAAEQAVAELADWLGRGIADIACLLNPAVVVLGGGIMEQREYLAPIIDAAVQRYLLPVIYKDMQLKFAQFGNDAGLVGALVNFWQRNPELAE